MPAVPVIHRHASSDEGAMVNAYLIESERGVVAVDSMLTVADSTRLRGELERLGKPLLAVLLTQSHPDHYGGLTALVGGDEVPILAPQGVHDVIRRDDALKEQILRPMFGDQWPRERTFPNTVVTDGESVEFDGVSFTVIDLGPSESPHDSPWLLGDGEQAVFLGDQIYDRKHCYLADGFGERWLANIETLRGRLSRDAVLYVGHGGPVGSENWDWQRGYIETFLSAVGDADGADLEALQAGVVAAMRAYLPVDDLQFLMELSVAPVRAQITGDGEPA